MRWPFTTRARLDDALERLRASEAERRTLVNRLIEAHGGKAVFQARVVAEVPTPAMQEPPVPQTPTRPTIADIRRQANEAKRKAAAAV